MRIASLAIAAFLVAVPLLAPAPAQAAMIGAVQLRTTGETAQAIDDVALRHRHHRHVRHRRAAHRHAGRRASR